MKGSNDFHSFEAPSGDIVGRLRVCDIVNAIALVFDAIDIFGEGINTDCAMLLRRRMHNLQLLPRVSRDKVQALTDGACS